MMTNGDHTLQSCNVCHLAHNVLGSVGTVAMLKQALAQCWLTKDSGLP